MEKDDQKKPPQSDPDTVFDADIDVFAFCERALKILDNTKELLDALERQTDHLEDEESDKELEKDTRIARTLVVVVEEKAGELSREAIDCREMLEKWLHHMDALHD
jgi:hypothetical protein